MRHCTWPFPDIRICYFENQKHHGRAPKKRTLILQVSGLISGPFPLQCLNSPDAAPFSFRIFLFPRGAETWWHLVTRGSGVMSPGVGRERIKETDVEMAPEPRVETLSSLNWYLGPPGGRERLHTNKAPRFPPGGKSWEDGLGTPGS